MILTRTDRIIIDDLPGCLAKVLGQLTWKNDLLKDLAPATYTIEKEDFTYLIEEYNHKDDALSHWRSHRQYIYIYIIVSGEEIMEVNDISELRIIQKYNSKTDQILYTGSSQTRIRLRENNIVILYPEDAYRIHYNPNSCIKKCTIKIPF